MIWIIKNFLEKQDKDTARKELKEFKKIMEESKNIFAKSIRINRSIENRFILNKAN